MKPLRQAKIFLLLLGVFLFPSIVNSQYGSPTISTELYKKYLERYEAEKAKGEKYITPTIYESEESKLGKRESLSVLPTPVVIPVVEEQFFNEYVVADSETVQVIKKPGPRVLDVFGKNIFEPKGETKAFSDLGEEPASKDYILGPGDRLILRLWGETNIEEELTIDREGNIFVPKAGPIAASGYTIEQFREKLAAFLKKIYSNYEIDVTLGRAKLIKVFVIGEVEKPGSYVLSGLASVLNALDLAGGPTSRGSFRNIKVFRRGDEIATLDLYELIRLGRAKGNIQLASNDVIFVPPAEIQIKLRGHIKHPAIFEMKKNEDFFDLINFAGGFLPTAFLEKIMVDRIEQGKRVIVDFSARDTSMARRFKLYDGDDICVFPVADVRTNMVTVIGQVVREGSFEFSESLRVSELLKKVGLLPDAYMERADIIRITPSRTKEILSFSPKDVLSGNNDADVFLQNEDKIIVYAVWDVMRKKYVKVDGAVRKPGEYELYEGMRISDLIFLAGGFSREADLSRVEVARLVPGKPADIFYVDFNKILEGTKDEDIFLQEDDRIFVRTIPKWKLQEIVTIEGEVKYPGKYAIMRDDEKLSDIIKRAGGFTEMAFLEGAVFFRGNIEKDIEQRDIRGIILGTQEVVMDTAGEIKTTPLIFTFNPKKLTRIIIDLKKIMSGDEKEDVVVRGGDWIYIPPVPSGVSVVGSVPSQGTIKHFPKGKLKYYIERAGGFTKNADKGELRLVKANGKVLKVGLSYAGVEPGDVIVVPQKIKKETEWGKILRDGVSILSGIATTIYIILKL